MQIHADKEYIYATNFYQPPYYSTKPFLQINRSNFKLTSLKNDSLNLVPLVNVKTIETFENQLILSGPFDWPDGISYSILSFDRNSGACLHKIKQDDIPITNNVIDFAVFDSNLFVGTSLSPGNKSLYKINLNTFSSENWNTSPDFPIKVLTTYDSNLWAIGEFVKDKGYARLEVLSPVYDSSLLQLNIPIAFGDFKSMYIDSSELYFGGDFLEIEGLSHSRLANYSGINKLLVPGINSIYPDKTANYNILKFNVNGYGFQQGAIIRFKKGLQNIIPDSLIINSSFITGVLILNKADTGLYDVIVYQPNGDILSLKNALLVEEAEKPDFWIDLLGPEIVLAFHQYNYILSYGNNSNAGYLGIPIAIAIPDTVIFSFKNEYLQFMDSSGVLDSIESFVISDTLVKEYLPNNTVYGFMIPYLGPNSTSKINLTLNVPIDDWYVAYCIGQPLYDFNDNRGSEFVLGKIVKDYLLDLIEKTSVKTDMKTLESSANELADEIYTYILNPDFPSPAPVLSQTSYFGKLLYACDDQTKIKQDPGIMMSYFFNGGGGFDSTKNKYAQGFLLKLKRIKGVYARDPNIKYGPSNYYVRGNETFRYMITFENDKDATAPAKMVSVVDYIDTKVFDLNSLQVISYGFGENYHDILPGIKEYSYDVFNPTDTNTFLRHAFEYDHENGILNWSFNTIDQYSLLHTTNALSGFLPPNKTAPEGEGYVLFTLKLKPNLLSGTKIQNQAAIFFDYNEKIETPMWENQIDNDLPLSQVDSLHSHVNYSDFIIKWSGSDSTSGIQHYNIYVSENYGPYYPWLLFSKDTFALFSGTRGNTYQFYSIASDFAFNEELPPPVYDASTYIVGINSQKNKPDQNVLYQNMPNPAKSSTLIKYYINEGNTINLDLYSADGQKVQSLDSGYKNQGYHSISFDVEQLKNGIYFYSLRINNQVHNKRLVVVK